MKFSEMLRINRGRLLTGLLVIVAAGTILSGKVLSQNPDYSTPGAPIGSYKIGSFENLNLYTGNLNINLPLLQISGRGDATQTLSLPIERQWSFSEIHEVWQQPGEIVGNFTDTAPDNYMRSYVEADIRADWDYQDPCAAGESGPYEWIVHYTFNVRFIDQDGTEYQFRDSVNLPPDYTTCGGGDFFYGNVLHSASDPTTIMVFDSNLTSLNHPMNGYIIFPNGTRIRFEQLPQEDGLGEIKWKEDRNGNRINYNWNLSGGTTPLTIIDSLGRETKIETNGYYGHNRVIKYYGSGGVQREIQINFDGDKFRNTQPGDLTTSQTYADLFAPGADDDFLHNAHALYGFLAPTSVVYPNGSSYQFQYNVYGQLARVVLPTGAAYEYDYFHPVMMGWGREVVNRLKERREYDVSGNLVKKTVFEFVNQTGLIVTVKDLDASNQPLSFSKHYFHGYPAGDERFFVPWRSDKEFKTEVYSPDGNTLLKKTEYEWKQRIPSWCYNNPYWLHPCGPTPAITAPTNGPFIVETTETITDGNLVKKTSSINPTTGEWAFDGNNNQTDVWYYDYGVGAPGAFLKRTHTSYVTSPSYTNCNTSSSRCLASLPSSTWVSSDIGGYNKASLTTFEYDGGTLLDRSSVIGHNSASYGTSFITRGNLTKVTSYSNAAAQSGAVEVHSQYDILGNLVETTDANGNESTIGYSDNFGTPDSNATTNTAPTELNGQNTFAFPTNTTNPLGWTSYVQYDYFTGAPVNAQDINGIISKTIYNDVLDRPTQTVGAVGTALETQTTVVYDDANRRVQTTADLNTLNDNLLKSESFYDGFGRTVESRTYKDGGYISVKTEYDALGRVSRVSNPYRPGMSETPVWTESAYDSLGRVVEIETPDGAKVQQEYEANAVTVIDQAGKKRRSITNAIGQLVQVDEPDSSGGLPPVSLPSPSPSPTPEEPEPPIGCAALPCDPLTGNEYPSYSTYYTYDVLNNLTTVTQGVQNRYFMYDSVGRLLRIRQPEQEVNSALNTSGNPGNNSWTAGFTYDANGNILTTTDANNVTITSTYDALNRQATRSYSDSTPTVSYIYDDPQVANSKGKLTKVSSSVSESKYTGFDAGGRLLEYEQITDGETYTSSYEYNLSGALTQETYPSGRIVQNSLDADGDLAIVKSRKNANQGFWNYAGNFSYNASGAVTSMRLGNGLWEKSQYNSRMQISQLALGVTSTDTSLWKVDYEFGELQTDGTVDTSKNNGDIGKQTLTVPGTNFVQTYKYDPLNRLTEAKEKTGATQNWIQQFGYDRYGNRTSFNQTIGSTNINTTPAIDADTNRFDDSDFTYDANGNVVGDIDPMTSLGRTFAFNGDNKQTEVKRNGITIGRYYYDGEGRRIKKVTDTETTVFVYSAGKLIAEYSTELSQTPSASYLTNDHLGSPRIITNELGQVKARRDFMPFGKELFINVGARTANLKYGASEDEVRQKFTSYERDNETDLDFAEARMYNSQHGRFTAIDPLIASGKVGNPQTWNRYAYVLNNPLVLVDPNGEFPMYFYVRSFAPYSWFGPGNVFRGDNRGFSTNTGQEVTSRVQAYTSIETDIDQYWTLSRTNYATVSYQQRSSTFTQAFGSMSEADYGFYSSQSFSEAYIDDVMGNYRPSGLYGETNCFAYGLYGNNDAFPLGYGDSNLSADIDLHTDMRFTLERGLAGTYINFSGTITGDQFPAAEAFVRDAQGNAVMLGAFAVPSNAGPMTNLPGNNQRPMMNVNVTILANDDGIFQGVMENGNRISIEEWNRRFTSRSATP